MNCGEVLAQLDSWIDCPESESDQRIEEHMSACPSCSAEAERRQFLSLQLSQLVEEDANSVSETRLESIARGVTQKLDHLSIDSGAIVSQIKDSQSQFGSPG